MYMLTISPHTGSWLRRLRGQGNCSLAIRCWDSDRRWLQSWDLEWIADSTSPGIVQWQCPVLGRE